MLVAAVVAPGLMVLAIILFMGAISACLFLLAVFGNVEHLGATLPATLVSVILGTASAAQNVGAIAALGVGGYIALAGLWAAPVSGTSMNPARSFGPALIGGDFHGFWVDVAGPVLGALLAVGCAIVLRGRDGSSIARAAGSGALDPGSRRARQLLAYEIDEGTVDPSAATGRD